MKNIVLALLTLAGTAHAYEAQVKKGALAPTLEAMIEKASAETGVAFTSKHFQLIEERELATSKYYFYVQSNSMIPVAGTAIRIWKDLETDELKLAELHLDEKAVKEEAKLRNKYLKAKFSPGAIKSKQLSRAIEAMVAEEVSLHGTDSRVIGMKFKDQWINGDLVRTVEVRGRRGVHNISVSLLKNQVIKKTYSEFPQSENVYGLVYPIYEEVEGTGEMLEYELMPLKYLDTEVKVAGEDPLSGLGDAKFEESNYHPLLAGTLLGDMYGLWSEVSIRTKVENLVEKLPSRPNTFESGLMLSGKYATINIHPAAKEAFKGVNFELKPNVNHLLSWVGTDNGWIAKPVAGFAGKPIFSAEELLERKPVRLADHDPASYINAGADEVQVYYAVTTLMDALVEMGFTDKELSEKAFHAFLYDPDIAMKDNAYYYDNTINFTTYSPDQLNYARDNSTIWHELGHAVMERIMGVHLGFAGAGGYGGLSEGMADFVAQLVVQHQTGNADFAGKDNFRIINNTGFYLTNEFHDEGEAYGGAMNDMLLSVIEAKGKEGLVAFTDLTLEAMRLTRNHPALTAAGWFEHMLIADEFSSSVRTAGQFKEVILNALVERNFSFAKEFKPASMKVTFDGKELTDSSEASREKPITTCGENGVVSFDLKLALTSGDSEFIEFPALVKVEYKKGALQGAIKWEGEANNPQVYTIHSEDEILDIPVKASLECDYVNQPDGSCKDYAYIQVYNSETSKPVAKKRFYLMLNKEACQK